MATETSNIDDFLLGGKSNTQPAAPEFEPEMEPEAPEIEGVMEVEPEKPFRADNAGDDYSAESGSDSESEAEVPETPEASETSDLDDYGNKKAQDNEVIRERLARQAESLKRQHQAEIDQLKAQLMANQGVPQGAAEGFEYNPESSQTWDQQLARFVEHTVTNMTQRQQQQAQQQAAQAREQQVQAEFEGKFHGGMANFPDFVEVVGKQPVSDNMVMATRGMKDPAAFLYAASKRMPQELQRIAAIQDPYAQAAEMGRLEATLRQTKPGTKAPKPVARPREDTGIPHKSESEKQPSIEDQIAQADRRKMAKMNARRR